LVAKVSYIYITLFSVFLLLPLHARTAVNDPTKPLFNTIQYKSKINKKSSKKKQLLNAIFIKPGNNQVLINDKIYNQGDFVYGKKIVTITANSVLLKNSTGFTKLILIKTIKKSKIK